MRVVAGLVVREIAEELLVSRPGDDTVQVLSGDVVLVWRAAAPSAAAEEPACTVAGLQTRTGLPQESVTAALAALADAGLIDGAGDFDESDGTLLAMQGGSEGDETALAGAGARLGAARVGRRALLTGAAALTAGGVLTVHMPAAAAAGSLGTTPPVAVPAYAFGDNRYGQLGNPTNSGSATVDPTPLGVTGLPDGTKVTTVAAGANHSLVLTDTGLVYAFGNNQFGQLGNGDNIGDVYFAHPTPTLVTNLGLAPATAIAAGRYHSLVATSAGVYAFGSNQYGQLGTTTNNASTTAANPTPTLVPGVTGATAIAAGQNHSLAATAAGLYSFGSNRYGQLGTRANLGSSSAANPTPTLVAGVTAIVKVAAGLFHSLASTSAGVYAFGYNNYGQLGTTTGNGTGNSNPTPTLVPALTGITAFGAGQYHSLVATNAGVYAFGNNQYGQLGTTTNNGSATAANPTPTLVPDLTGTVTAVGSGSFAQHSLVATSAGVYAFGSDSYGQLGNGVSSPGANPTPTLVSGVTSAISLAAGQNHSLTA